MQIGRRILGCPAIAGKEYSNSGEESGEEESGGEDGTMAAVAPLPKWRSNCHVIGRLEPVSDIFISIGLDLFENVFLFPYKEWRKGEEERNNQSFSLTIRRKRRKRRKR